MSNKRKNGTYRTTKNTIPKRINKHYYDFTLDELMELSPNQFKQVWNAFLSDCVYSNNGKIIYINNDIKEKIENNPVGFYIYTDEYRGQHRRFKEGQTIRGADLRVGEQSASQDTALLILDFIPSEKASIRNFDDIIRSKMSSLCVSKLVDDGGGAEWIEVDSANPVEIFREAFKIETQEQIVDNSLPTRASYTKDLTKSISNLKAWKAITEYRSQFIPTTDSSIRLSFRYQILKHCGTRKTTDIYKSMSSLIENDKYSKPSICLFGAHLNNLLNQQYLWFVEEDKTLNIHGKIAYLGIASANILKDINKDIRKEVLDDKQIDLTFHSENNPKAIKEWIEIKENDPNVKQIRVFFNYDSSDKVIDGLGHKNIKYAAYDEVDNTVGILLRQLTLHNNNIYIEERAMYTASPRYNHGMGMENIELYGLPIFRYTMKEGVEDGIICNYKILILQISDPELQVIVNNNSPILSEGGIEGENAARIIACLKAYDDAVGKYGIKKSISFHSQNVYAEVFKRVVEENKHYFPNLSNVKVFTVKGGNPEKIKKELVKLNNVEEGLICNCRVLGVGTDVPNLELAIFVDPKGTIQGIVQAVGRIQRKVDGKEFGYVLLPVVVDGNGELIRNRMYQNMIDTLSLLQQTNEFLRDEIIQRRRNLPNPKPGGINVDPAININWDQIIKDIGVVNYQNRRYLATIEEVIDVLKSIKVENWEQFIEFRNNEELSLYNIPNNIETFYGEDSRNKLYEYLQLKIDDLDWLEN